METYKKKSYMNLIIIIVILVVAIGFLTLKVVNPDDILLAAGGFDQKITIANTTDIHGHLVFDNEVGDYYSTNEVSLIMGMPLIKGIYEEIKKKNKDVLFLDSGDMFHGTNEANIDKGAGVLEVANLMGYNAMTPGNHDFNFGIERLLQIKKQLNFPMLSANVYRNGKLVFDEYKIIEVGGIKIGLFGLTTPEAVEFTNSSFKDGLTIDEDYISPAKAVAAKLKDKTDMVILISHLSSGCDREIAQKTEGIDLIFCGHGHELFKSKEKIKNTYLVSAGAWTTHIGFADIYFKDGKVKEVNWTVKTSKDNSKADKKMELVSQKYHNIALLDAKIILGKSDVNLDGIRHHLRTKETNLANMLADAMREAGNADLALLNGGGIRGSIPMGDINLYKVGEVLPFSNSLVTIELKGEVICRSIERGLRVYPSSNYGAFLQVSGIKYVFDGSKTAGGRLVSVTMDGKPLDMNKYYRVATNDYIYNGGDGYKELKDAKLLNRGPLLKDVLIQYIKQKGTVTPKEDGRIEVINQRYK